jgi:hypothetical protein
MGKKIVSLTSLEDPTEAEKNALIGALDKVQSSSAETNQGGGEQRAAGKDVYCGPESIPWIGLDFDSDDSCHYDDGEDEAKSTEEDGYGLLWRSLNFCLVLQGMSLSEDQGYVNMSFECICVHICALFSASMEV